MCRNMISYLAQKVRSVRRTTRSYILYDEQTKSENDGPLKEQDPDQYIREYILLSLS